MAKLSLLAPYTRFAKETAWLLAEFDSAVREITFVPTPAHSFRLQAEMCIMRLDDAWARFCRELIISSAGCRPTTATGRIVPRAPQIHARREVIPRLFSLYRNHPNREPDWGSSNAALEAAKRLKIANLSTVSAALGATNSPAFDVRQFRNFLAHRYIGTADRVKQRSYYRANVPIRVDQLPVQRVPPGVTLIENWVARFRLVAEASIQ